jgi:hypothetical protein
MPRVCRAWILTVVAAAATSLSLSAVEAVNVEDGTLAGTAVDRVRVFKGIPHAAPPVELRAFHAAEILYVFNIVPSNDPRGSSPLGVVRPWERALP